MSSSRRRYLAQEQLAQARTALRAALRQVSATEDVAPVLLPNVQFVPELRPCWSGWMIQRARALARAFRERRARREPRERRQPISGRSIRVFTFGGARIFVGENLVEHWRLPAAREMLCYLLDHREPVRKEASAHRPVAR